MKRKTDKVEEAAGIYQVKPAKPVEEGVKYADVQKIREQNARLIKVHQKVLQKLAQ